MKPREERTSDVERRAVQSKLHVRQGTGQKSVLSGYGAVYGKETVLGDRFSGFREVIEPGAFDEAVTRDDVRAVINHDPNLILGRNTAGTLKLTSDIAGLFYEIDPPDTSYARDLLVSVKRGDITQSSFAFRVPEHGDVWEQPREPDGLPLRRIKKVQLFDVSPVTYAAYAETTVSARAQDHAQRFARGTSARDLRSPVAIRDRLQRELDLERVMWR